MKKKIVYIIIVIIFFLLLYFNLKNKVFQSEKEITIATILYSERQDDITIQYPEILGIKNKEKQKRINQQLKEEAFRAYQDDNELVLEINYDILYQSNKIISIKYNGYMGKKDRFEKKEIYTTINIDLKTGNQITLSNILKVDDNFVAKLRETFHEYIEKNPSWESIYLEELSNNNEYFLKLLLKADQKGIEDCFSYYTKDGIGICFAKSHLAGNFIEIEMNYNDINTYIIDEKILSAEISKTNEVEENNITTDETITIKESAYFQRDKHIEIHYPEIFGINDVEKKKRINQLLKEKAFSEYWENDDLSMQIEYEIVYQSDKFMSVKYTGFRYSKGAAFPRDLFFTINIDLKTGKQVPLSDIVKVDEVFVEKVRQTIYKYIEKYPDWEIVYQHILIEENDFFIKKFLSLNGSDKFYFTGDKIGISFYVTHNAGDHLEIEMSYKDLEECIINKDILD